MRRTSSLKGRKGIVPSNQNPADDDDEFDGDSNLVKQLRKQLEKQSKENERLSSQLGELSTRDRTRTLTEALTAKGLSEKAAKFYPADAELSDEAITAWIGENADIFGVKATTDDGSAPTPGEGTPATTGEQDGQPFVVDPATEQAYRRMQAASLVGSVATSHEQDLLRQVAAAESPEQLTELLRSARA